jgi:hypothetical protein
VKHFQVLHSMEGLEPYPQTLDKAGQRMSVTNTSSLQKFVDYKQKKFYNIGPRLLQLSLFLFEKKAKTMRT